MRRRSATSRAGKLPGRRLLEPPARPRPARRRLGRHPGRAPGGGDPDGSGRRGLAARREPVARGGGRRRRARRASALLASAAAPASAASSRPSRGRWPTASCAGTASTASCVTRCTAAPSWPMLGWALLSSPWALVPLAVAALFLDAKRRREEAWLVEEPRRATRTTAGRCGGASSPWSGSRRPEADAGAERGVPEEHRAHEAPHVAAAPSAAAVPMDGYMRRSGRTAVAIP